MMSLENWATAHGCINDEWVQIALLYKLDEPEDENADEFKERRRWERCYQFIAETASNRWNDTHFVAKPGKNYTLKERDERIVAAYLELCDQLKIRGNPEEAEGVRKLLEPVFAKLYKPLNKRERDLLFKEDLIMELHIYGVDTEEAKIIAKGITAL